MWTQYKQKGFTIVELLIVIIVIAILATISIVAYNGIQARARDAQRAQDIKVITKALEMYYIDNGEYPFGKCTAGCVVNGGWSTTNDASWSNLANALVPKYISSLPSDPQPTTGSSPLSGGKYGYGYFASQTSANSYCGITAGRNQMFILVYTFETSTQNDTLNGTCTTNPVGPYVNKSSYRVAIGGS